MRTDHASASARSASRAAFLASSRALYAYVGAHDPAAPDYLSRFGAHAGHCNATAPDPQSTTPCGEHPAGR
jgi:hypothetical protein